jgi:hypothetical protein
MLEVNLTFFCPSRLQTVGCLLIAIKHRLILATAEGCCCVLGTNSLRTTCYLSYSFTITVSLVFRNLYRSLQGASYGSAVLLSTAGKVYINCKMLFSLSPTHSCKPQSKTSQTPAQFLLLVIGYLYPEVTDAVPCASPPHPEGHNAIVPW